VQRELLALLDQVDVVATPTSGITAPTYISTTEENSLDVMRAFSLIHTAYWDPTGCPAIVVPMGFNAQGLPLSLQFGSKPFAEAALLRAADAYQQSTAWHLAVPPLAQPVAAFG
jgi:aspartyl-tRNA(Asn)/glutamyl-tRNA(Gln) amidotransferase subunit A